MGELNFSPGDKVRLRLAREELDCTILQSADSSVFLVKLDSGYNIGIPKENVLAGRVLKKFEGRKEEEKKVIEGFSKPSKKDFERRENGGYSKSSIGKKGLKNVGLIVTGGTIAAKLDARTGGVHWLTDFGEFSKFYPELFEIVNVKKIDVPFMIASESMTSEHWIEIAKRAKQMLDDSEISGVIITHGTDFLHYTSAALSFFLRGLNKPVVFTYSQRSVDRASSDASLNLQCAAHVAKSDLAEVVLVGHGTMSDDYCLVHRGTKVRKLHTSRRDAFKSVNEGPIAKVFLDGKIEFLSEFKARGKGDVKLDSEFSDKVALIKFYPGQDASILDFYALKFKGVVIEASGLGHLPTDEVQNSWIPKLKKHIRNGLVVCAASQTVFGRLDPYVYSNGRELMDAGVIFLEDMLAETALVKLGWVLGHYGWKKNVKEKMLENVAGELNEKLGREFL